MVTRFVLDTGAPRTVAPLWVASTLLNKQTESLRRQVEPTGMKDVHGREVKGLPLQVELELNQAGSVRRGLSLQETIWFCEGMAKSHGLLGQTAFERFGALFLNFPYSARGRRFGLYLPPAAPLSQVASWLQGLD